MPFYIQLPWAYPGGKIVEFMTQTADRTHARSLGRVGNLRFAGIRGLNLRHHRDMHGMVFRLLMFLPALAGLAIVPQLPAVVDGVIAATALHRDLTVVMRM